LSFPRHKKIYQSDGLKRELNWSFSSLTDHRSDESSTGYSFMSCSPVELMSASPAPNSFSLNPCCCTVFSSQPQLSLFFAVSTEGSIPSIPDCHLVVLSPCCSSPRGGKFRGSSAPIRNAVQYPTWVLRSNASTSYLFPSLLGFRGIGMLSTHLLRRRISSGIERVDVVAYFADGLNM
jgi:hypothetical protein